VITREISHRVMISICVVTGLNIAVLPWMERATLRDLATLRPALHTTDAEYQALEHSLTRFPARTLWIAAAAGLVGQFLLAASARGAHGAVLHRGLHHHLRGTLRLER
jgi:hypothetical protein